MIDKVEIFRILTERQRLRDEAGLPRLNFKVEYDRAVLNAQHKEYEQFCQNHGELYETIKQGILEEYNRKGKKIESVGGNWLVEAKTKLRFEAEIARRFGLKKPIVTNVIQIGGRI